MCVFLVAFAKSVGASGNMTILRSLAFLLPPWETCSTNILCMKEPLKVTQDRTERPATEPTPDLTGPTTTPRYRTSRRRVCVGTRRGSGETLNLTKAPASDGEWPGESGT